MVATAQFGRLDSGAFPCRTTTDDDHIIMIHYLYYRIIRLDFSQSVIYFIQDTANGPRHG